LLQRWMEWLRTGERDQTGAVRAVTERAEREVREAVAAYDAFVEPARAVTDGLHVGTANSSQGEQVPIRLPWGEEHSHWLVQGGTGTGKTTWITEIFRQELVAGRPVGLIDCKGDLFDAGLRSVAAVAHTLPEAARAAVRGRLVVVNPFADELVPLNVCRPIAGSTPEVQAYEITLALSRLFETSLGLHMESILRHLVLLLMETELSLAEAPLILRDDLLRGILANRSANPAVKDFFLGVWPAIPQVSKDALLSRLQGLLLPENVRLMLGADTIVDLRGILERGDPVFVFLGKGPGVPEEQVELIGSLVLQLLFQAAYARPLGARRPYLLAMDEFSHLLAAPALAHRFETALTTVRSFGLTLLLVHHNVAQLPANLREILLANCDFVALFRTSARNAEFFGDFLPETDPPFAVGAPDRSRRGPSREDTRRHRLERLQRLPNRQCYWYDRHKTYRALRLRVPDVSPAHEVAGCSAEALEALVRGEGWDRGAAGVPRAELRAQLEARRRRLHELVLPPARRLPPSDDPGEGPPGRRRRPKLG
jgi:hypothetical protein